MKTMIIIVLSFATFVLAQNKYKEIDFDLTEVLDNPRLLNAYTKCLLNKGPCTPEVKQLKDKLPEALETNCAKCTESQKQKGKQLAREVKRQHPELWNELVATYDPQGKYQKSFKEFLSSP